MNTPKLLSITAILAMALTGASIQAQTLKPDAIVFKDPKAIYKVNQTGTIALATAFAATSKTPLTFTTTTPDIVSIPNGGTTATILKAGTASITAVYPANPPAGYSRAANLTQSIVIAKAAAPKIAPVASDAKPVYSQGKTLNITLPSGKGLPADYNGTLEYSVASGNATVDAASGLVTLTGAGAVQINVTPSTSPNYATAAMAPVKFTVALGTNAVINPVTIADTQYAVPKTVTIPQPTLSPDDATGGTFTFSTTSKTAKISGNTITLSGAGPVVVLAAWSGSAKYAKTAKPVQIATFNVSKADDVLTKTPITAPAPGASVALPALVSSPGKAKVVYTQTSGSGATVASGKVTPNNAGTGFVVVSGTTVATVNFNAATPITYTVGWSYSSATKKYTFSAN